MCPEPLTNRSIIALSHNWQGFYDFDPFIPIRVDKFTEKEMESALDYYQDRGFLMRPESVTTEGRDELKYLSSYSPKDLYRLCASA